METRLQTVYNPLVPPLKLRPTGKCFDDAMEYLEHIAKTDPLTLRSGRLKLAHGILRHASGEPFSHAWVEEKRGHETCVIEAQLIDGTGQRVYMVTESKRWYRLSGATDVTLYSMHELLAENQRTESYGPWKQCYLDLTRESKAKRRTAEVTS